MERVVEIAIFVLPVLLLSLLVGLGSIIAVLANEGRGRSGVVSRLVGLLNLLMILPLATVALTAPTRDVRWMFAFGAGVFALLGLLGLRMPARYRD